jgi:hypothetical protein
MAKGMADAGATRKFIVFTESGIICLMKLN